MSRSPSSPSRRVFGGRYALAWAMMALVCALATAEAGKSEPERNWIHPEFDRFVLPRIALLPVVPVEGGLDVCPFVEKRMLSATTGSRMRWMPAVQSRERLKVGGSDSLLKRVSLNVLRNGRVDSTAAPQVARTLGVRGLLSVRIDLWRRESARVQGRTRAVVGLTAALVDSTGTLLWSASGRGEYESAAVSAFTDEFGQAPADYDSALIGLLGRWGTTISAARASAPAVRGP